MGSSPAAAPAASGPAGDRRERLHLRLEGIVQGVGFRPFAFRLARTHALAGWAGNDGSALVVELEGPGDALQQAAQALRAGPPGARIDRCAATAVPALGAEGFVLRPSLAGDPDAGDCPPDLPPCPDCLRELFDPGDRRHRYPFLSCTRCGPRWSILLAPPFDRANTTLAGFPPCADCRREYVDPDDRRFHAQTLACPACGPRLALWRPDGTPLAAGAAALDAAIDALARGAIVAAKGVGGFHLLVDATDAAAVARLRSRKRRPHKPFAVLFRDLAALAPCGRPTAAEAQWLAGPAAPIVLVDVRDDGPLAPGVGAGSALLGALLPPSPLHHLLARALHRPLVCTSGNLAGEALVADEREAPARLGTLADLLLVHDRPIRRPLEDSVWRTVASRPLRLRRARGEVPGPIDAGRALPPVIACGGHLKSTIAIARGRRVRVSEQLGDLGAEATDRLYRATLAEALAQLPVAPRAVACDQHPGYASSRHARTLGLPVIDVQHHHAHALACLADNALAPPVLAVVWDGAGLGSDGTLWGGEFLLLAPGGGWRRAAHLAPFRLPGGEQAMREPRRAALGALHALGAAGRPALERLLEREFAPAERGPLLRMLEAGVNAPWSSGAGRLFDAAAALLGLCARASYEAQAGLLLETAAARGGSDIEPFAFGIATGAAGTLVADWGPALLALLDARAAGVPLAVLAARWHATLAALVAAVAQRLGEPRVLLAGGCFQNRVLTELTLAALRAAGHEVYWHRALPPNDGALALGQVIAAAGALDRGESR